MLNWINKKRNKKGFTLVELIVVIAILGILAALAVPRLTGSRQKANRSAVLANLRTIESALSIAEAEGVTIAGREPDPEDEDDEGVTLIEDLVEEDYLSAVPEGPGDAIYSIIATGDDAGRAGVDFGEGSDFEFVKSGSSPYTLNRLSEPTD